MGNYKTAFPSDWLRAEDLEAKPGHAMLLTIAKFGTDKIGDDTKPCVWFRELDKGLVLNRTNAHAIADIAGSDMTEEWIGKRIVAYKTTTEYRGDTVPCIRIRAPRPGAVAVEVEPEPADDGVPF